MQIIKTGLAIYEKESEGVFSSMQIMKNRMFCRLSEKK